MHGLVTQVRVLRHRLSFGFLSRHIALEVVDPSQALEVVSGGALELTRVVLLPHLWSGCLGQHVHVPSA